jgi:uncharacterized membrane protein
VNLRRQPFGIRLILWAMAVAIGLTVGFALGLGFIAVVVAVFGHADDTHPLRQFVVVGAAYAVMGLTGVLAAFVAWRRLFR